jgi:hypothetical protein
MKFADNQLPLTCQRPSFHLRHNASCWTSRDPPANAESSSGKQTRSAAVYRGATGYGINGAACQIATRPLNATC